MPDDRSKTALDRNLISTKEEHEVRDWTKALECTKAELMTAIEAVGHSAAKVREYLDKSKRRS